MSDREAIKEIINYYGVTVNSLAKGDKALQRKLQRQINEGAAITADTIRLILEEFPDVNPEWLMAEKGKMLKDTETHARTAFALPFLDIDASAGFSEIEASNGAMKLYSFPRCDAAMPVRGLSMEPNIHDGDIAAFVMLPSAASMRPDGIYIVQYDDGEGFTHITVKRAKQSPLGNGYIRLAADNPEYGFEDVPLAAISRVALVKFTITPISY